MPFLDGRMHIFTCGRGHKWETGDARHHPYHGDEGTCPHGTRQGLKAPCLSRCVSVQCPKDCIHYREPDGLIVFAPTEGA
jgi:hypothetical protein